MRCASQAVWVVDHMRLGVFNVSLRVVEPAFPGKRLRQKEMNLKRLIDQDVRGRDFEGYFEIVNGFLRIAFGVIYLPKNKVTSVDHSLFAFLREETDRVGSGFFCGVELFVAAQH